MTTRKIRLLAKRPGTTRARLAIAATAGALAIVPASVAHADWYLTKARAQSHAKHFVSTHYADTFASDLTTYCRPQGRSRANSRYVYHRWVCGWVDSSDDTSGVVRIIGSSTSRGAYYGTVIVGAH